MSEKVEEILSKAERISVAIDIAKTIYSANSNQGKAYLRFEECLDLGGIATGIALSRQFSELIDWASGGGEDVLGLLLDATSRASSAADADARDRIERFAHVVRQT